MLDFDGLTKEQTKHMESLTPYIAPCLSRHVNMWLGTKMILLLITGSDIQFYIKAYHIIIRLASVH